MKLSLIPVCLGILFAILSLKFLITYSENYSPKDIKLTNLSKIAIKPNSINLTQSDKSQEFEELVKLLKPNEKSVVSIYIKNLKTNQKYVFNEKYLFYGASLFKVPLAYASLNSNMSKNNLDLISSLLKNSDNQAQANLQSSLSEKTVNEGFIHLVLSNQNFYIENKISAQESGEMFEKLETESTKPSKIILELLESTAFDNRITQGLSTNKKFSHKIGNWGETNTWHDCGVVYNPHPVVVCLMTESVTFDQFLEISKKVGQFVNSI